MATLFIAVYWGVFPSPSIFCRKWPWLPLLISSSKEPAFFMISPRLSTSSLFCHVLADRLLRHLFLVYRTRTSLFTKKAAKETCTKGRLAMRAVQPKNRTADGRRGSHVSQRPWDHTSACLEILKTSGQSSIKASLQKANVFEMH